MLPRASRRFFFLILLFATILFFSTSVRSEWEYFRIRSGLKCAKLKFERTDASSGDVFEYKESLTTLLESEGICNNSHNESLQNEQLFELNKLLEDNMFCSTKNAVIYLYFVLLANKLLIQAQNITPFMEDYALASVLTVCGVERQHWGLDHGYGRLFDFLFKKRNVLREALCQELADEHEHMVDDCALAVRFNATWGNRCINADQVYSFSWYFLRVVQKESDQKNSSLYLFGDEYMNESMLAEKRLQKWFDSVQLQMNERTFLDPRTEIFETYVDGISLMREAMKTPLMLNNFGLAIRQVSRFFFHTCSNEKAVLVSTNPGFSTSKPRDATKYLIVECKFNSSNRENDTLIRYFDFEPLISMQNFHNFLHVLLILFSYASNIYAKAILYAARKTMDSTTFFLIKILFNTNMIIITTNLWSLIREHIPIKDPFEGIEQFPASFFSPDFQQNITFLVARAALSATYTYSEGSEHSNVTVHFSNGLSIVNNGIQSLSQAIGAIVLLVIMCVVLYELRISFCGRLSSRHFHWCQYLLYIICVVIALIHVAIAVGQFFALDRLNVLKQEGKRSQNLTEYTHVCREAKKMEDEVNLKINMVFMIGFNVAAVTIILVIIAYHQLVIRRISLQIPKSIQRDMSHAIKSILLATLVYIIANGGLTYIAAYLLLSKCITEECISLMTLAYHWTRLLCLMDPILHPIIVIRRVRGMLATHREWQRYDFPEICKKCVRHSGKSFVYISKMLRIFGGNSETQVEKSTEVQPERQYLDIDLQTLLKILEDEKNIHVDGDEFRERF
ncbi:hypothetical protein L596_002312 [Steinernema carpocapsae]|uniref:G-protein coupled receptors family 1 profile domain-containing protein n=1 Tax=Steinernema carpocapsae TaxID=34508 RepID=A0A4U8UQS2_STECR|nr:hypothetical protein L596_002312 [Steinernema carpocapsae]